MRGWQEWIVALLLAYCTVCILRGIASFWRRDKKKKRILFVLPNSL